MDIFKERFYHEVDLDDMETYPQEWLEIPVQELFYKCWTEAGQSLFYMQFFHPDIFLDDPQYQRVNKFCKELVGEDGRKRYKDTPKNKLFLLKWLYKFVDEIENQC